MPATIETRKNTMADKPATALTEVEDRFISHWGDISALWGVNRRVVRIHALLFLSRRPLEMETITERLQISRGNCSTSIRDLLAWNSIRRVEFPTSAVFPTNANRILGHGEAMPFVCGMVVRREIVGATHMSPLHDEPNLQSAISS